MAPTKGRPFQDPKHPELSDWYETDFFDKTYPYQTNRYSLRAILKYGWGTCFFGLALDKEKNLFARQMSWSYQILHKYCTPERIMYLKTFHLFGELYCIFKKI